MTEPEMASRKVWMSSGLMAEWASRDLEGNRLSWEWGEPDDYGFYTPAITRHYDDNLRAEAAASVRAQMAEKVRALPEVLEVALGYSVVRRTAVLVAILDAATEPSSEPREDGDLAFTLRNVADSLALVAEPSEITRSAVHILRSLAARASSEPET